MDRQVANLAPTWRNSRLRGATIYTISKRDSPVLETRTGPSHATTEGSRHDDIVPYTNERYPIVNRCRDPIYQQMPGMISPVHKATASSWIMPVIVMVGMATNVGVQIWTAAMDNHVTATEVQALTIKAGELTQTMRGISDRLALMPRPDEIADTRSHIDHLDQAMGAVQTTVGVLDQRVHALESPIIRQPR